ncbi:hypothetical protein A6A06_18940 [Streptomyces sp. CB02923]|nr:hypothetical protein A6A06_18940 [Streptomyces sp. CB02923]
MIEVPDGSLAACALGLIHPVLPAPAHPRGLAARVRVVATQPDFRRRGYARAVVSALLDRLHADHVTLVGLHAGDEAAPLYRELGFEGSPAPMRMTRKESPAFPNQSASGPAERPQPRRTTRLSPNEEHSVGYTRKDWSQHYTDGHGFRPLGDEEKKPGSSALHRPSRAGPCTPAAAPESWPPSWPRSGTPSTAPTSPTVPLRGRARSVPGWRGCAGCAWTSSTTTCPIRPRTATTSSHRGRSIAFLHDRARVLHRLATRLRQGGALVVITPTVTNTPDERRHIALDEDELEALADGFHSAEPRDAKGLAMLLLREP